MRKSELTNRVISLEIEADKLQSKLSFEKDMQRLSRERADRYLEQQVEAENKVRKLKALLLAVMASRSASAWVAVTREAVVDAENTYQLEIEEMHTHSKNGEPPTVTIVLRAVPIN